MPSSAFLIRYFMSLFSVCCPVTGTLYPCHWGTDFSPKTTYVKRQLAVLCQQFVLCQVITHAILSVGEIWARVQIDWFSCRWLHTSVDVCVEIAARLLSRLSSHQLILMFQHCDILWVALEIFIRRMKCRGFSPLPIICCDLVHSQFNMSWSLTCNLRIELQKLPLNFISY